MTQTPTDRYLTVAQVAELVSTSEATVRRWIRSKRLKAHKVRGLQSVRIRESDVHALMVPNAPKSAARDER